MILWQSLFLFLRFQYYKLSNNVFTLDIDMFWPLIPKAINVVNQTFNSLSYVLHENTHLNLKLRKEKETMVYIKNIFRTIQIWSSDIYHHDKYISHLKFSLLYSVQTFSFCNSHCSQQWFISHILISVIQYFYYFVKKSE